jgi:hypothetical protein
MSCAPSCVKQRLTNPGGGHGRRRTRAMAQERENVEAPDISIRHRCLRPIDNADRPRFGEFNTVTHTPEAEW